MVFDYKEDWYKILKEKRKTSGLTQTEIAEHCNTYKSKWSRYESGHAYPSVTEWFIIFHYLNCSQYDFFNMTEDILKKSTLVRLSYSLINMREENGSLILKKFIIETISKMKNLID